jgi:hypothetical protein
MIGVLDVRVGKTRLRLTDLRTRLRLTVLRTRRAAIQDGAPRLRPAPRFTRRRIGLLRIVSEANERRSSSVGE